MKTNVVALVPVQDFTQAATLVAVPLEAANEKLAVTEASVTPVEQIVLGHPEIQQQRQFYTAEHIRQQRAQTCCLL
jgi:hypothetical protein